MVATPAYVPPTLRPDPGLRTELAMQATTRPGTMAVRAPRPLVLAIDYDGTLDESVYPAVGRLKAGAKEALLHFKAQGHTLIVWTCRSGEPLRAAVDFLRAAGVPFDYVNENTPELIAAYGCDCRKISADLYLDDRAAGSPTTWRVWRYLVDVHAQAASTHE